MNRNCVWLTIFVLFCSYWKANAQKTSSGKQEKISTSPFNSSTKHWYGISDKSNIINPRPGKPQYNEEEITNIADNILIYQRENGGWPKNYDMRAVLTDDQKDSLIRTKHQLHTTFDNSTTYTHIEYLAKVYQVTKAEKYKEASLRGIDFILSAQYPNGGWPQYFPLGKNYSRRITFNDGAFIGIMTMLKDIVDDKPPYMFVEGERRKKVCEAFEKGLDCIMKCQIQDGGQLTAWCQQHNENDLSPAWARAFEPPSICNQESADIVLFLMRIGNPSSKVINAIQCAATWFASSKITGITVNEVDAAEMKSAWTTSKIDRIVVSDSSAPPIWTRYYELGTHKPLFCDRNGKFLYSLSEVSRERRSGYAWYTYKPQDVLDKYPAWQKKWVPAECGTDGFAK